MNSVNSSTSNLQFYYLSYSICQIKNHKWPEIETCKNREKILTSSITGGSILKEQMFLSIHKHESLELELELEIGLELQYFQKLVSSLILSNRWINSKTHIPSVTYKEQSLHYD